MPRKTNGYGNFGAGAVRGVGSRTDIGKAKGAAGTYPSNREYGSSVTRSVIEKWNLDSDWVKWRKGYEYYSQAAWYRFETYDPYTREYGDATIHSKLYQGTPYEVDVTFDGYHFATSDSDSNNHYVVKRTPTSDVNLGTPTQVLNDPIAYPLQKANRELWVRGSAGPDSKLLARMVGERITDGETEATLANVLTAEGHPSIYIGKSLPSDPTIVTASVSRTNLAGSDWIMEHNGDLNSLVGMLVYLPEFYVDAPLEDIDEYEVIDEADYFGIKVTDSVYNKQVVQILDPSAEVLPPALYDISTLPKIYTYSMGNTKIEGTFVYKKDQYQKHFGTTYMTGDLVMSEIETVSYTLMPYTILSVLDNGHGQVELKSVPFMAEFNLYAPVGDNILIFADYSFTKTEIDTYDGEYYHPLGAPDLEPWRRLDTDVDPWMDEIFTSGNPLKPAVMYTCSCPSYTKSILRAPQSTQDEGTRKINRQRRYPMPTVLGTNTFESLATNQAAGVTEGWDTLQGRMQFKMCKHSIAAMFIERLKVKEPNSYPTVEARIAFEQKLSNDIATNSAEFKESYKRGGITLIELVFALAQGLKLDDTELAYILFNTDF